LLFEDFVFFFEANQIVFHDIYSNDFLIGSSVFNLLYLAFNCFIQLFPFYYRDKTIRAFILCKIRFYFGNVLGQFAIMTTIC